MLFSSLVADPASVDFGDAARDCRPLPVSWSILPLFQDWYVVTFRMHLIAPRWRWLRDSRGVIMLIGCLLVSRPMLADSFTESITPPGDDLQVADQVPNLFSLGPLPNRNGWQDEPLAPRLAYRSDHVKPGPKGSWVDKNLTAPRTWVIQNVFHRMETVDTIVEKDRLCLGKHFYRPVWSYVGDLYQDYWYFYSRRSLLRLGASIGVAAVLANTSLDQEFQDWFQDNVATQSIDWEFAKLIGEPWVMSAFLLSVWAIDEWAPPYGPFREYLWTPEFGYWSRQSLRALLVGAPVVGTLQFLTGASRPGEAPYGSEWRPFNDNNGVSGHTFIGAVPFLVAAKRADHFLLKAAFYAGSGLTGYSRLNDNAHYLSQVLLGWSIAYLSVEATQLTEQSQLQYRIVPISFDGLIGIGVEARY